ncbi:hypothetical protein PG989_006441 [Apiospora arundinis]
MLISNIVPFMATAAAVFAPAAAAWDYKLKWHSKTTCSTKGGPTRSYDRGTCIPLSKTDHGVTVVDHRTPCRVRGWGGADCQGDVKTAFSTHQCHSLKGIWSVKIEC